MQQQRSRDQSDAEEEEEEGNGKVLVYVGNIDGNADEEDLRYMLEIPTENEIIFKEKVRKRTKVQCKDQINCEYGHKCRYIHTNELNETMKYALIETTADKVGEITKYDGELLKNTPLIIDVF